MLINKKLRSYLQFWLLFFFITSIVVFPQIKGTTPAFILSFTSLLFSLFVSRAISLRILFFIISILFIWIIYFLISQFFIFVFVFEKAINPDIIYISNEPTLLFRSSFFTQSLYLIVSLLIFFFVKEVYEPKKHDKFIFYGASIILIYGYYEIIYFGITGNYGDFLSNRVFGENESGSLLQTINFSGFQIQRFKSLTGEPSMYVFSMFPVFVFAYYKEKRILSYCILLSLFLTFSTTFFIGIFLFFIERFLRKGLKDKFVIYTTCATILCALFFLPKLYDILDQVILQKIMIENTSGVQRSTNFLNHISYFSTFPFPLQLFGLGFGYMRSTDFLSTLLVNLGILGFLFYTYLFIYPIFKLPLSQKGNCLKVILFFIYLTSLISIPEFSYPSIWLFLGISYNYISHGETNTIY